MAKEYFNPDGLKIPAKYVPSIDKKKDRLSISLIKKAKALQSKTLAFKQDLIKNCDAIYDEMLKDANIKVKDRKGNYTITSFDKKLKIEINVNDRIEFDDNINLAKEKLEEFLASKTEGVDTDLSQIIQIAFKSSKGNMDTKRIMDLFSLKINKPLWLEAMELIKKSMQRNVSKRYVRIWEKDAEGKYKAIELNFSSL